MKSFRAFESNTIILSLSLVVLLSFAGLLNKTRMTPPAVNASKEVHSINFTNSLTFLNFGLKRFLSSILWIDTLISSDLSRNFSKNSNSWMYYRFITISQLDPKFLQNYQFGGQYLAIIKDDLLGAEIIYTLGIHQYPNDYFLNYNLAFLYFHEMNNPQKALPYFINVKNDPKAPQFIDILIATIMEKNSIPKEEIIKFIEQERLLNKLRFLDSLYEVKLKKLKNLKDAQ